MRLSYRGYAGSAEMNLEDNCLHGRIQHIDDVVTYEGNSPVELKSAFESAVDRYLEYCQQSGKEPDRPYGGSFNIRIGPDRHKQAAKAAQQRGVSLNELIITALDAYLHDLGRVTPPLRNAIPAVTRPRMVADIETPYEKKRKR